MTPTWWVIFNGFVLAMLVLDLGVFHRKAHEVKVKEAIAWSVVWIALALLFNLGLHTGWVGGYPEEVRSERSLEFLTGYLVEKSLSVDNLFVFALLFSWFRIPAKYQHRVLFWGILGALVMRGIMIFAGVSLIHQFHWLVYVFGAVLVSGIKMWFSKDKPLDPEKSLPMRLMRRLVPVTETLQGSHFFVRIGGALTVTPLFVALVFVEWSDLIFAVDSIPAILAITDDTFIIYTSNVMAMLGLRSLYFALAGVMERFHLLHYGLSLILMFVGAKMALVDVYKVPTLVSLGVIASILTVFVLASLRYPKRKTHSVLPPRAAVVR